MIFFRGCCTTHIIMEKRRRRAEAARIRMRRYRERMSQEQREDILDRRRQSCREEAEAITVRDREDYLQNEQNLFQSRIQSMTQEHFFSTAI